jgi:N-acetylglucosamine-6-sulfatase
MMKRHAIATGCTVIGLILVTACEQPSVPEPRSLGDGPLPDGVRPNVVLVLTDDQRADDTLYMPHVMSRIAHEGTTFRNAFVTQALCCPSRASILTGMYTHNHGVLTNKVESGGAYPAFAANGNERRTLAVWLKNDGYATGLFGKYMNNYEGTAPPQGWTRWFAQLHGTDDDSSANPYGVYFGYEMNDDGVTRRFGAADADYSTDLIRARALAFIATGARADAPFFAFVSVRAPHRDGVRRAVPAPRHAASLRLATPRRYPSFNEADVSDKPLQIYWLPYMADSVVAAVDSEYVSRQQSLLSVDELVGAILDTLETTGALHKTYVIFMSDNGWHQGEHRRRCCKNTGYEWDIRVPLFVRGPGVAWQTRDEMVLNIDVAPTIAALAGATTPPSVDGRSFAPLLAGQSISWRWRFLIESHFNSNNRGVRTEHWKYLESSDGFSELYDLHTDPDETNNLALADTATASRMRRYVSRMRNCSGASC